MASVRVSRVNRILVAFTVLCLLASLLAPGGGWQGVDVGAIGQVLYTFGLAILAWQAGWNPDSVFPLESSVAERRGWIAVFLGALVLISFLHFLWHVAQLEVVPESPRGFMSRQLGWNLSVLLIAWIVVSRALGTREQGAVGLDERDLRIRHAATRFGDLALTVTVAAGVVVLASTPAERLEWWLMPLIAAQLLIGVLVAKALAENLWLVASYARERS